MRNETHIQIKGARTRNLKNIDINIKLNAITCLYGPSGSGKSSLAFGTLVTESKRRFINSFPSDIKFFWDMPNVVDVDSIGPVLPVWSLAQNNPIIGSRPSVGDILGLTERFQSLFFACSKGHCSKHDVEYESKGPYEKIIDLIDDENETFHVFALKESYVDIVKSKVLPPRSFNYDSKTINSFSRDDEYWELFRFKGSRPERIKKQLSELSLKDVTSPFLVVAKGSLSCHHLDLGEEKLCPVCGEAEKDLGRLDFFSPYNALGACGTCQGHGMNLEYDIKKLIKNDELSIEEDAINFLNYKTFAYEKRYFLEEVKKKKWSLKKPVKELPGGFFDFLYEGGGKYCGFNELFRYLESKRYKRNVRIYMRTLQTERVCPDCDGARLNKNALLRKFLGHSLKSILKNDLSGLLNMLSSNISSLNLQVYGQKSNFKKIMDLLKVANEMELGNLPVSKKAKLLTPSEYQRLLLIKYLSFEGSGSLFVLDEPSVGLSKVQQKVFFKCLQRLKKQGNTVLLVDHSEEIQKSSDEVIQMGPGAGVNGGKVLYQGPFKKGVPFVIPKDLFPQRRTKSIEFKGVSISDAPLRDFKIPSNQLSVVKGGGSLKGRYFIDAIANEFKFNLSGEYFWINSEKVKGIKNNTDISDVLVFSTSPMRASSRSTVGTMIGISPIVRKYFSGLPVSKSLGLADGHFSPNSDLGKCLSCDGKGKKIVDMQFLEDIEFSCDDCKGMKLRHMYATISDGDMTVHEAFSCPMSSVMEKLKLTPKMKRIWEYVQILNLSYLSLGRSLESLSGGERQRLKLLAALQKDISNTFLVFENLSFGLSNLELSKIVELLHHLLLKNNTIVLVDENELMHKFAHRIIDV